MRDGMGTMDESSESVINGVRLTVEYASGAFISGNHSNRLGWKSFDPSCMEAIAIVPPP